MRRSLHKLYNIRKKGAVELSINTIVIVVIGITILTLGLKWIYDIFGGIGDQTKQLRRISESQILDIFGQSDAAIYTPQTIYDAKQGKKVNIDIFFRNTYQEPRMLAYDLNVLSSPPTIQPNMVLSKVIWTNQEKQLASGDAYKDIVLFDTKKLPLGTYKFEAVLSCADTDCIPESVQFLVNLN